MPVHDTEIVGRDEELQTISSFLEQSARASALLIEGDAGIGKTTLWRWGVEHAVEHRRQVLSCRAGRFSRLAIRADLRFHVARAT